jgi:hypothetical protein
VLGETVARARQDSEKGNRAELGERTTHGRRRSRRWTAAACTAVAGGAVPAAEQRRQRSRGQRGFRGRRREGTGPKD